VHRRRRPSSAQNTRERKEKKPAKVEKVRLFLTFGMLLVAILLGLAWLCLHRLRLSDCSPPFCPDTHSPEACLSLDWHDRVSVCMCLFFSSSSFHEEQCYIVFEILVLPFAQ